MIPSPPSASDNFRAAALVAFTMSLFAVSDAAVKSLFDRLPVGEVMGLRGILITGLLLAALWVRRQRLAPAQLLDRIALLRAAVEVVVAYLFFMSLAVMPLADATVLLFAAPIIMTVMAALFMREKVGPRRWTAVITGFLGVVLVAGPGNEALGLEALLPLACAFFVSIRDIVTRFVPKTHDSTTVALTTALAVMLGGCLSLPLGAAGLAPAWLSPSLGEWTALSASAILIGIGYVTAVTAYRLGETSFLAPFRYAAVPLAIFLSWSIFGDVPSPLMLLGALIITGSGIFIFTRERQLARRARLADGA